MAEINRNSKIVPVGPGGVIGKIARVALLFSSAGFIYPNVFLEGVDMNELHKAHMKAAER